MPGIPVDLKTGKGPAGAGKKLRGKEGVRMALQLAQQSTASMGRYFYFFHVIYSELLELYWVVLSCRAK